MALLWNVFKNSNVIHLRKSTEHYKYLYTTNYKLCSSFLQLHTAIQTYQICLQKQVGIITNFRTENCNFTVLATVSSGSHKKISKLCFFIREVNLY